jgi:hypothetical protein
MTSSPRLDGPTGARSGDLGSGVPSQGDLYAAESRNDSRSLTQQITSYTNARIQPLTHGASKAIFAQIHQSRSNFHAKTRSVSLVDPLGEAAGSGSLRPLSKGSKGSSSRPASPTRQLPGPNTYGRTRVGHPQFKQFDKKLSLHLPVKLEGRLKEIAMFVEGDIKAIRTTNHH